jgi:electron transfer flavoprotein alpha subunit
MSEQSILSIPIKPEDHKNIWIFAEVRHGQLMTTAFELLNIGRTLADDLGEKLVAVIFGKDVSKHAQLLIEHGADQVFVLEHDGLAEFVDEVYGKLLVDLLIKEKPNKFLLPASTIGRSFGSRVAIMANTGITADATELNINKEKGNILNAIRPSFGGTLMATTVKLCGACST